MRNQEREMREEKRKEQVAKNTGGIPGLFFFACFLLFVAVVPLFSQNAEEIEVLLSRDAVTYEEAAWFVLRIAEVPGISGSAEAFDYAWERYWLPSGAEPGAAARLDGVALLVMQSFGYKGGAMYTMTKSSRYAYRELVYCGVIQGRVEPAMNVSGELLLYMAGRVLEQ